MALILPLRGKGDFALRIILFRAWKYFPDTLRSFVNLGLYIPSGVDFTKSRSHGTEIQREQATGADGVNEGQVIQNVSQEGRRLLT
jgi:hypothetical protein